MIGAIKFTPKFRAECAEHGVDVDDPKYAHDHISGPMVPVCGCGNHPVHRPRVLCDLKRAKGLPLWELPEATGPRSFAPGSGPRVRRPDGHGCSERIHPAELAFERKYGAGEDSDTEW